MLSELTLTVMRLGLLVLLWVFVFAVVGVLRGDLYGTRVKRRTAGAGKEAPARRPVSPKPSRAERKSRASGPTRLVVTAGPLSGTTLPLRPGSSLALTASATEEGPHGTGTTQPHPQTELGSETL